MPFIDWKALADMGALKLLLRDITTGRNIMFMTDEYGGKYPAGMEITPAAVLELGLKTRTEKSVAARQARTKAKAEVFTPAWLVNHMVNKVDSEWFGRDVTFNNETEKGWKGIGSSVSFAGLDWRKYVSDIRLEITCGEAPFITSRYDAVDGHSFRWKERIGILDRKLKIVTQQCRNQPNGLSLEWGLNALKACYGYEYQGDSLLIARANVLLTFLDFLKHDNVKIEPDAKILDDVCGIICSNFWQMDGLENVVPGTRERCRIMDWNTGAPVLFDDCTNDEASVPSFMAPVAGTDGYFDVSDGAGSEPDGEFEPIGRELFVASSVGLLASSIDKSTLRDDAYGRGEKLARQMALQYYSTAQGFQAILDKLEMGDGPSTSAGGFIGLVDRIAVKGRVTGAMKSSLISFRNEAFDPMMKLCRDAVELLLWAVLCHQRYGDMVALDSHDLRSLVRRCEWDVLPDGLESRIHGFVIELAEHDVDPFRDAGLERKGADLGTVILDTGRLFDICSRYIFGN